MERLKPVNQNVRVYDIVMLYIFCVSKQQLETEAVTMEVKCMCAQTKKMRLTWGTKIHRNTKAVVVCLYGIPLMSSHSMCLIRLLLGLDVMDPSQVLLLSQCGHYNPPTDNINKYINTEY